MTEGHKHREVRIDPSTRIGGAISAWLRKPRRHVQAMPGSPVWNRIDRSPYPYGLCNETGHSTSDGLECYYLSVLSVLHRWTGFTIRTPR